MKDFRAYAISEAANTVISEDFISAIKNMDQVVAINRIASLLNSYRDPPRFTELAGQFIALVDCKTCVDT